MLHVITKVGESGYDEREKKHYPCLHNRDSVPTYKARGRRYIPHGYGEDVDFVPHNQHIDPLYSDCGPDWKSRIRWIPSPHSQDYPAVENWPTPWKSLRTYPWVNQKTEGEWQLFPEGKSTTLRSTWDGVHKATQVTKREVNFLSKPRPVVDKRNGIPMAAPGDKSYQAVEYSPNFYKFGSTLPVVNFGGSGKVKPDAYVQLSELPPIPKESYINKEQKRRLLCESDEVKSLENWRPATPLRAPKQAAAVTEASIPERNEMSVNSKY